MVVKVRRPDVIPIIEQDLEILQNLARRVSRRWEAAADYNLTDLASEFARTLRGELDYLQEGRNAELLPGGVIITGRPSCYQIEGEDAPCFACRSSEREAWATRLAGRKATVAEAN